MFDIVTQGFKDASLKLKGQTRLTEENISPALDTVRRSLLDADVDYGVVKNFLESVRTSALGSVVHTKAKTADLKASAGDHFIKLCHDELLNLLGGQQARIEKNPKGPTVILLVGLQGAGKTTHAAKLARLLKETQNMRPLLIAADVYRPAAREQLKVLGERIDVPVFTLETSDAVEIARKGLEFARQEWLDLVIVDTAGRLAVDDTLMTEIENIKSAVQPQNVLLVIDAMIGQDAVRTASAFDQRVNLTGVILTKLDGDTRGGAALSIKKVTGKNILFTGVGESLERLEEFRPEGMATRILGMGDVVGLMQDFSKAIDEEEAARSAGRMMEGHFDFNDFLGMLQSIQKMGPLKDIISKTPLAGQLNQQDLDKVDDREMVRVAAIVRSMTRAERENPELLLPKTPDGRSRHQRIARGSGRTEKDVKDLVERFMQMKQMMGLFTGGLGGGLLGKIPGMGGLNQLANMAKMMRGGGMGAMGGLPGMAGMGGMGGMMGGFGGGRGGLSTQDLAEINRQRKKKKEEKKARSKGRR
ncbi:MAG: signal recognition particle protein [Proteobacteria bacterium]|nr:signal recognition particle protein [Pseudomonadota bacterium]